MDYKLKFDLHTHTVHSHGKGNIIDNVKVAHEKGLNMIGIADHGPGHKFFGMDMKDIPIMRKEIEEAKALYPDLDIQLSVEANIINPSGIIDVSKEEQTLFDYVIAGYHYGIFGDNPMKSIKVILSGYTKLFSDVIYNTDIIVKALYENNIKLLTHPGDKAKFDIGEIAKACEDTNTWMEINDHHNGLSVEGIKTAAKYNVQFIISSDAHLPNNVGNCDNAVKRAITAGLPLERIINLWN